MNDGNREGSDGLLAGFLFGNIDESGRLENDFFDQVRGNRKLCFLNERILSFMPKCFLSTNFNF